MDSPGFDLGWSIMERVCLAIGIAVAVISLGGIGWGIYAVYRFWEAFHG